jgi:DNA ligase-4
MQTTFQKMIDKLGCTPADDSFFIEDKLDGERMQMHMQAVDDEEKYPGGRRFGFWSRKGKDYTYLYGSSFGDDNSSLTRFIKDAFDPRVKDIILDGEMITWDPESDKMVGFGSLKSAAIAEKNNPFGQIGNRPLFRVFDCLYLNGKDFTKYSLRERRKALNRVLKNVDRRIEIHEYQEAKTQEDIETRLREVVAEAWEGLVLKNPRSMYLLNSRTDDWIKVKPEYMSEFGESLDCVVIGGYWGSGKRGGRLSSFLCGLRVNKDLIDKGWHCPCYVEFD